VTVSSKYITVLLAYYIDVIYSVLIAHQLIVEMHSLVFMLT